MNAKEFEPALEKLGVSHNKAGALLGIGRSSVIRYAHAKAEVPETVRRLIILLLKHHGVPKEFAQ